WQQLNRVSLGAAGAEQFLVSLSRGKQQGLVFTDLSREELVAAIKRADDRKSATEVFMPRPRLSAAAGTPPAKRAEKADARAPDFIERVRRMYREWKRRAAAAGNAARIKEQRSPATRAGRETGYGR